MCKIKHTMKDFAIMENGERRPEIRAELFCVFQAIFYQPALKFTDLHVE